MNRIVPIPVVPALYAQPPRALSRRIAGHILLAGLFLLGFVSPIRAGFFSHSIAYSLDIGFTRMPANDDHVAGFLDMRAGIHKVKVTRLSNHLNIKFETSKPMGVAILLELVKVCDSFGYQGRTGFNGHLFDAKQQGSRFSTFWVEYARLPENDRAATTWLQAQAGASKVKVRREGNLVAFEFENSDPPDPALLAEILQQCEKSGYQGRVGFIHAFGRYP